MSRSKDVSIIIVNWNTKKLLLECINSLKKETYDTDIEIIVVDNASKDGSQEALQLKFPDVKLIQNQQNLGFAKANNIGIKLSKGNYLCLVNSDVQIRNSCIDKMKCYMDNHLDVGMVGPKIFYPDGSLQISCKRFPSLLNNFYEATGLHLVLKEMKWLSAQEMKEFRHDEIKYVDCLSGSFWLVRKQAVESVGGLDENFFFYGEDIDWCKRFWDNRWRIVFFPDSEIIHNHGASSSKNPTKYYIQLRRAKQQYWVKHFEYKEVFIIQLIWILHQVRRIIFYSILSFTKLFRSKDLNHNLSLSVSALKWLIKNFR